MTTVNDSVSLESGVAEKTISDAQTDEFIPSPPPLETMTKTTACTSAKRQLTLMDIARHNSASKKQKISMTTSVSSITSSLPSSSTQKTCTTDTTGSHKVVTSGKGVSAAPLQKLNSIPLDFSKFLESLTLEQRDLLKLECEVMGKSWLKLLKDDIKKPYFLELKKFLWEEGVRGPLDTPPTCKVYPGARDIYAWSNTPLGRVKVVIIGQDPYHGKGQAHGLCFSVPIGVTVPPSLRNIYKELKEEYPEFKVPNHGNLSAWASNGVLLLNTCLTVRAGNAGSHSNKGWELFTERIVEIVDQYGGSNLGGSESGGIGRGVVFLAWGSWAAKRVAKLSKTKHLILTSAHPSPFSVAKGFSGNNHFKQANNWLQKKYGENAKVDWCDLEVKRAVEV